MEIMIRSWKRIGKCICVLFIVLILAFSSLTTGVSAKEEAEASLNLSDVTVSNEFDEEFAYTNLEDWGGLRKYTYRDMDNGAWLTDFATIESNVGVNGTKAIRFCQIRGSSQKDALVSYVRLYDTAENSYRLFTPEANTKYVISIRIKVVASSKPMKVELRNAASDGTIAYTDAAAVTLASELAASEGADWQELTAAFTTGNTVTSLYIALAAIDGWWAEEAEVYVDDINIIRKVHQFTNDFDESDAIYTNTEGWLSNAITYSVTRDTNSELCAEHASVDTGIGVNGSKAARFWQIRGSSENDSGVSYIRLYDTAENGYALFVAEANRKYTISLKIKAVVCDKNICVELRSAAADGTITYNDAVAATLTEGLTASADADWQELTVEFITGDAVTPLYIALRGADGWYAVGTEVYVDDIAVFKSREIPKKVANYNGEDEVVWIVPEATFAELEIPIRSGYEFAGWYTDAAKTQEVAGDALAAESDHIWVKWQLRKAFGTEPDLTRHLAGDLNDDKNVDMVDLIRLKKMAGGAEDITYGTDLDGDGSYALWSDLNTIRQYILGAPESKCGRKLVWSEEFNYTELDTTKWKYKRSMSSSYAQYSDANNLANTKFKNGNMTLQVNRIDDTTYSVVQGLVTQEKMLFRYGYLEMRAKLPSCEGSWPSLWMMANTSYLDTESEGWYFPEIDIFEAFGNSTIKVELHKHFADVSYTLSAHESEKGVISTNGRRKNLSEGYHIFGFLWDETSMKFYVDDELYCTVDYTGFTGDGTSAAAFQSPFYLLLNNEILNGQSWTSNWVTSSTKTPIEYSIDYIRLYQNTSEDSDEILYTGELAK